MQHSVNHLTPLVSTKYEETRSFNDNGIWVVQKAPGGGGVATSFVSECQGLWPHGLCRDLGGPVLVGQVSVSLVDLALRFGHLELAQELK